MRLITNTVVRNRPLHWGAIVLSIGLCVCAGRADFPSDKPLPGITYKFEQRADPPMRWHVVTVDLTRADMKLRVVPGGPDPDGEGRFQTTLMRPTDVAARERFDLVINGDFFEAKPDDSGERYHVDQWARVLGPAASGGKVWATATANRPFLLVRKNGRVSLDVGAVPPADASEVIAGNVVLVQAGRAMPFRDTARHPRTAVGLDKEAKTLVILIVEGRALGSAVGMSYAEMAPELIKAGCHAAVNLDGGGSTALVLRNPEDGKLKTVNRVSEGRERAVANFLGLTIEQKK